MALTDAQIAALRDLGQIGVRVLSLKSHLSRIVAELDKLKAERVRVQGKLAEARSEMQDKWEELRQ
jgi:hypothetical protein